MSRSAAAPATAASTAARPAENTRPRILAAAAEEFAANGLAGARVDRIALGSGCNKAMLYYFFKSKEQLYLEVLEELYADMRGHERDLDLTHLGPVEAIRRLVEFKFDYWASHPLLIRLLIAENLQDASHLKRSKRLRGMHLPLLGTLSEILAAGAAEGTMRAEVDALQLYISMAALSYFYFSNAATLGTAFGQNLTSARARAARRRHVVEVVLRYLLTEP